MVVCLELAGSQNQPTSSFVVVSHTMVAASKIHVFLVTFFFFPRSFLVFRRFLDRTMQFGTNCRDIQLES